MKYALLSCLFLCFSVVADNLRPASLTIEAIDQTHFDVVWKVPSKGTKRLSLYVVFDDDVRVSKPKRAQFLGNGYIETWQIERQQGLTQFHFSIGGLQKINTDVLVRIIDQQKRVTTSVLNSDKTSYSLAGKITDQPTISTYIILGIEHILAGFDHLLFVACLVYISRTRRKLLLTITGFTLAHSVTLIMSATGVMNIPIAPVEAVIALSIVFLAVEIAKQNPNSLSFRYPVLVSSSFGLLHGFGFASVLSEIGLPKDEKLAALLSFNVGVEFGQLIFIGTLAILFGLAKWFKPNLHLNHFHRPISYFSGSVAMIWLFSRLAVF